MAALLILHHQRRQHRNFKARVDSLDSLSDREVTSRYRLSREGIFYLVGLIQNDIAPTTNRNHALSALTKALVALRFYAKGDFFSECGDIHGISKSSVSRCVAEVTSAINRRLDNISFPTDVGSLRAIKRKFYVIAGIPNVLGAIDGTLIPVIAPADGDEAVYICRKGYHALNVQAVVDANMRFTDVVSRWPGSQHDSSIFESCALKTFLEDGDQGWLLGDSGYPLRRYLITPKARPTTNADVRFNTAHTRTRVVVERAFGVLKSRFRCLHKSGGVLPFSPVKNAQIVTACIRLHNLCIDIGLPIPEFHQEDLGDVDDDIYDGIQNPTGNNIRDRIINMF